MSYATLMVFIEAEGAPEQRVRLSANLASKFSATLIGFSALAPRPPIGAEGVALPEVTQAELNEIKKKISKREAWFRKIVGPLHSKNEWRSAVDFPTDAFVREARCADLVVIGRGREPGDLYTTLDLGSSVLNAGRPVFVAPEGIGSLRAQHVVIGWKDTREARRAVQDVLPFLHESESVAIVEICEPGETDAAQKRIDDVANYLERHRIKAGPKITLRRKGSDAEQLIRVSQDAGADLLVTGAYGHTRLGEWLFGGITRELLASSPICCVMSH